jgi:hypothetical protein
MKKLTILSVLLLLLPSFIQAHEIKRVGTFEILSHREPEDNPIARETAQLYFSVTDSKNQFKFSDCDCRVAVKLGNETLLNKQLTAADEAPDWGVNVSVVDFVFPAKGLYVLTIAGSSKTNLYQEFSLDYDVRIERESATKPIAASPESDSNDLQNYYIIGGVLIVSGIIIYELISKIRKKKK